MHNSETGFWKGLLVIATLMSLAWIAVYLLRLSTNWEDGVVTTAVLFSALTLALRPAWPSARLWRDMSVALALHWLVLAAIVQVLTSNSIRMGGPLRTIAVIVEGVFLLSVLWRRNVSREQRSGC